MGHSFGPIIKRLILVGYRKNYVVPFSPGVNIIYGDADTGKSSILRIIYYCLGGKGVEIDAEIVASVAYVVLEFDCGDQVYCIRRDLYNNSEKIEVFRCPFDELNDNFPEKLEPKLSDGDKRSISEFLLDILNFPQVKLKQSPSKDDSSFARLSFLDLMKYCYMDQDDVGSKSLLDGDNHVVAVKNKEVFKYIFNVLDGQLLEIEAEIAARTKELNALNSRLEIIGQFLFQTEFETLDEIEKEISSLDDRQAAITSALDSVNSHIISNSELYSKFKDALTFIYSEISDRELKKARSIDNLERFERLKNDYLLDIEKLKAIEVANKGGVVGSALDHMSCPICETEISSNLIVQHFTVTDADKIKHEATSLNRRVRDLSIILEENRKTIAQSDIELVALYKERETATRFVDEETAKSLSPYLSQRDALIFERAANTERRNKYKRELKVRNLQAELIAQAVRIHRNIDLQKIKLSTLQADAPSLENIFTTLEGELELYLKTINIKNRTGVSIDRRSFLPMVRDKIYRSLNSGGLRTIVSIGYFAILQAYAAKNDINMPNLLMIDTVGKYLGKTKFPKNSDTDRMEDDAEGVSDPEKYRKIYEYLISLSGVFEERGKLCQIILVDNDVPPEISKQYKGFVVAHYSSEGRDGLPTGLIDDWDSFKQTANN